MPDFTIRTYGAARSTETDLDDGVLYILDQVDTNYGEAQHPEPQEQQTLDGATLTLPLDTAWQRRTVKIAGAIVCTSLFDKKFQASKLDALFHGRRTIRRHGWEMDVIFQSPQEVGEGRKTPMLYEYEVTGIALTPLPFWRTASTLESFAYDTLLYPDYGVPYWEIQPPYAFGNGGTAITPNPAAGEGHFSINNWGTAQTPAAIALSGLPTERVIGPVTVINPGGEITVGTEWSDTSDGGTWSSTATYYRTGLKSLKWFKSQTTSPWNVYGQLIPVTSGKRYRIKAWGYTNLSPIYVALAALRGCTVVTPCTASQLGYWTELVIVVDATASQLGIDFSCSSGGVPNDMFFYIDDVTVENLEHPMTHYLSGLQNRRLAITPAADGTAAVAETDRFLLYPGDNAIRLENAAGTAIDLTAYTSAKFDFGATQLRNL